MSGFMGQYGIQACLVQPTHHISSAAERFTQQPYAQVVGQRLDDERLVGRPLQA